MARCSTRTVCRIPQASPHVSPPATGVVAAEGGRPMDHARLEALRPRPPPGRRPGVGQTLHALGDDLPSAVVLPFLLPSPPPQAPFDEDAAAFAQRGADRGGLGPEGDPSIRQTSVCQVSP